MKKICLVSHCSDHLQEAYGAKKWLKSCQYFHPELPSFLLGTADMNYIFEKNPGVDLNTIHPFISSVFMSEPHGFDFVVHMDSDSMLTGRMTELVDAINTGEYDMIGVRNNNDLGRACKDPGITEFGLDVQKYFNCGLVAVGNRQFYEAWMQQNLITARYLPFQEQSVLNSLTTLVYGNVFKTHIIDPLEEPVYYGLSNGWGIDTHWDSWSEMYLNDQNQLMVKSPLTRQEKRVVVLHHGGGHSSGKLNFDQFNFKPDVRAFLETIVA